MNSAIEQNVYEIINRYKEKHIPFLETLKILSTISFSDRENLSDDLNDFLQIADLIYEDFSGDFNDLDEELFVNSINRRL